VRVFQQNKYLLLFLFKKFCDQVSPQMRLYTKGSYSCADAVTDTESTKHKLVVHVGLFTATDVINLYNSYMTCIMQQM
jgi:hypothetical protein